MGAMWHTDGAHMEIFWEVLTLSALNRVMFIHLRYLPLYSSRYHQNFQCGTLLGVAFMSQVT